jgi:ribonuclease BN (tRNA processing enzyme)
MKVTVLGCSGSVPGPDSPASGYLVEADGYRLVLDLGHGAFGALQNYVQPNEVDSIFVSHLHADHCIDLTSYYVLRKYHPQGAHPPIPVYGPDGTPGRLARAYDLPKSPGMTEEFRFHRYPAGSFTIGPFTVTSAEVAHPVPAYAMRIDADGRTLTYSGDTGECAALVTAARAADLFLCEASFLDGRDNPPGLHLTGGEAGRMATEAAARRLVLTHVPPWHDAQVMLREAEKTYDGPLELASPGKTYEI